VLTRGLLNLGLLTVLLAGVLVLGGCSVMGVLAATTPAHGARIVRDVAYGEGPRHRLDVYAPPHGAERLPVVVFFYGGTWQTGERKGYAFVGRALASRGFVAVVPDYRIYPEVNYPEFLRDGARAVRWTRDHAAEFGGDPQRIFLMGHSAGAYNAVMLALDRRWLGEVGMEPQTQIKGALGLAGPYDFLPITDSKLKVIFGPPSTWPSTQPIAHADAKDPPLWLAAGDKDMVVDPGNTTRLAARVREAGGRAEAKIYPSITHKLLIGVFAGPFRFMAPVLDDAVAFMRAQDAPR
jgi:acetyl esterase/lipase